jgi:hypothetical protein
VIKIETCNVNERAAAAAAAVVVFRHKAREAGGKEGRVGPIHIGEQLPRYVCLIEKSAVCDEAIQLRIVLDKSGEVIVAKEDGQFSLLQALVQLNEADVGQLRGRVAKERVNYSPTGRRGMRRRVRERAARRRRCAILDDLVHQRIVTFVANGVDYATLLWVYEPPVK